MSDIAEPVSFLGWLEQNQHLLKPPVNNKQMFSTGADFIVQVVGGPN
jgi:3-hydroxyanthranilate 3,4-dioxygenase